MTLRISKQTERFGKTITVSGTTTTHTSKNGVHTLEK